MFQPAMSVSQSVSDLENLSLSLGKLQYFKIDVNAFTNIQLIQQKDFSNRAEIYQSSLFTQCPIKPHLYRKAQKNTTPLCAES